MGLLDGDIASTFSGIFGAYFLDGMLHRTTLTEAADGDVTSAAGEAPIKYQADRVTEAMRQSAGYTEETAAFLVLQSGISPAPTADDEMTAGTRWAIWQVSSDPANSHWIVAANPA